MAGIKTVHVRRGRKMKAAVYYKKKDIRIEDVPEPEPGKGEVKVKVHWCGICGTDLGEYLYGPIVTPTKPHPLTGKTVPLILGHEFSGDIVELGEGVKGLKVGDRVTCEIGIACWECFMCKHMMPNICVKRGWTGLSSDGAFAEYVVFPAYQAHKIPDTMTYEQGALVEPLAVAVHGLRRGRLEPGENVLVVGAGPIGLCALQAAKASGAAHVYVSEVSAIRGKRAKDLGADVILNPRETNVPEKIRELTDGLGVDLALDCVGGPRQPAEAALRDAVRATRPGGRIVVIAVHEQPDSFEFWSDLTFPEHTIIGSMIYTSHDYQAAIPMIADGRVKVDPLVTAKIKLDDIVTKGFEELVARKEEHIKILVTPL